MTAEGDGGLSVSSKTLRPTCSILSLMADPTLTPRLIVDGADRAIDFYQRCLDAELLERFTGPDGKVVHAALKIRDAILSVADESPGSGNHAPTSLGGSSILLTLVVDHADPIGARMVDAGAETIIAIDDRFYGKREGRFRDPFGHLWIISQPLDPVPADEIQRRASGS